ncbi:MBL fold metallo-hydrolase [Pollutimonas bauzanensis]|uniref:Glyoxylase, beta-lactamase superfamily II n=1 Tax=Pollutimonas bauzanensis TaxID=658167 RepID=A0A1M5Z8M6_9BURK|nr:MBL fold metallo-hydrolase [Pollutimonas bauzanensis]SHI20576.1 Glyoxylase, beta-lactamase superfamily II [Pollutimonas bauzanensis]
MRVNSFFISRAAAVSIAAVVALSSIVDATAGPKAIPAPAAAQVRAQAPGVYRYRVGDFQVTALSDGTVPQDLHALLTNTTPAEIDGSLEHAFLSNPVEASINAFLIDTGTRLLLVDTGSGSLFGPGNGGKLLGSLKAAGYPPEQINDILLTHIHTDHSGGLVSEGQLVFPNATIHVGKPDVDLFLDPANIHGVNGYDKKYFEEAVKTVGPYVKAGKVMPFTGATQLYPGVKAIPAPGHTPGHSFYQLESKGESIEFIGDIVHVASVQFSKPKITILYDVSPKEAAAERQKQFAIAATQRELVAGAHLPFPGLGHIRAEAGGGYTFVPVDYRDRDEH